MRIHAGALLVVLLAACNAQESPKTSVVGLPNVPMERLGPGATYDFGDSIGVKSIEGAFAIGNQNAPVQVVVQSDFECIYCARTSVSTTAVRNALLTSGKIRYIHLDFPLPAHSRAGIAAQFARCAGSKSPQKFWEAYQGLLEMQTLWSQSIDAEAAFRRTAEVIGLEWNEMRGCLEQGTDLDILERMIQLGIETGVQGTPTHYFNGQRVIGAFGPDELQQYVSMAMSSRKN
jgi:protein-disulfide isomerase